MDFPLEFVERTRLLLGDEEWKKLEAALAGEPSVSIRVNRKKYGGALADALPVPWCRDGYYLPSRPAFTFDPLLHAGCYYVQEAASMFLDKVLGEYVTSEAVMLDLCAAPGGKSTLARSALPEGSLLVANEIVRARAQVLAENLTKWGNPGVAVTNNAPEDFTELGPVFDVILTDVPCSGEGMFRKDETAVSEWSTGNVALCWQRQRDILSAVWPCLKEGGLLIYSTCTFNREENEDNVAWIAGELGAEVLPVGVDPDWDITANLAGGEFPVYRFFPHKTAGEGLFMAVLRKTSDADEPAGRCRKPRKDKGKKPGKNPLKVPKEMGDWLLAGGRFRLEVEGECAVAFPASHADLYDRLKERLKVVCAGVTLAEWKGKDWQPAHSLAMSTGCRCDAFPQAELSYKEAIAYLRKEAVVLPSDMPRGYVMVTFRGHPLGFVKNVGNRANNLYPQEWRIRSGSVPEQEEVLK